MTARRSGNATTPAKQHNCVARSSDLLCIRHAHRKPQYVPGKCQLSLPLPLGVPRVGHPRFLLPRTPSSPKSQINMLAGQFPNMLDEAQFISSQQWRDLCSYKSVKCIF